MKILKFCFLCFSFFIILSLFLKTFIKWDTVSLDPKTPYGFEWSSQVGINSFSEFLESAPNLFYSDMFIIFLMAIYFLLLIALTGMDKND